MGCFPGRAPLRGRAGLELIVHPFGYRDAARFWGITDPRLAVLVRSWWAGFPLTDGNSCAKTPPRSSSDFDASVIRTVLNPQTHAVPGSSLPSRRGDRDRDPSLYHSVLATVAEGNTTTGGSPAISAGNPDEVARPLRVLKDSRLLIKEPDLFRSDGAKVVSLSPAHHLLSGHREPEWARLELGGAASRSGRGPAHVSCRR